jgi:hypothetical protein
LFFLNKINKFIQNKSSNYMAIGLPPKNSSDGRELASSACSVLAIVQLHEFVGTVNDGIEPGMQGNAQPKGQCADAEQQTELCV